MLNIYRNQNNVFIEYLNDLVTITDPFFIFEFVDVYGNKNVIRLTDESTTVTYNQFEFYDSSTSTFSLVGSGNINIYESALDASVIDNASMNLLKVEKYKLIVPGTTTVAFDPYIVENGTLAVFDPIWESGDIPQSGIPASTIIQDSTHRFITDASYNYLVSVSAADGKLYTDACVNALRNYTDGSLNLLKSYVDSSILTLTINVNSSLNTLNTKINNVNILALAGIVL